MREKYRVLIDDGEVIRFPDGNVLTESELDEVNWSWSVWSFRRTTLRYLGQISNFIDGESVAAGSRASCPLRPVAAELPAMAIRVAVPMSRRKRLQRLATTGHRLLASGDEPMLKTFTMAVRRWLYRRKLRHYVGALSCLDFYRPDFTSRADKVVGDWLSHGFHLGWSPQTTACVVMATAMAEGARIMPLVERERAIEQIRNGPYGVRAEHDWLRELLDTGKVDPNLSGFVIRFAIMSGLMGGWLAQKEIDVWTQSLLPTLVVDSLAGVDSEVASQRARFLIERIGRPESSWPEDWRTKRMPQIVNEEP